MAALTTLDGHKISLTLGSVTAVADHDLNTGDAGTCVYGIAAGAVRIARAVKDFIDSLGLAGNFMSITLLNGLPIFISAFSVRSIRQPESGEYADVARSVISVGALNIAVADDIEALTATIEAHGGKI